MKEILYIVLDQFADHEIPFLAQAINTDEQGPKASPKYVNKIMAPTMAPLRSIGGFNILPDYDFNHPPRFYAALVLVGGYGWKSSEASLVAPVVRQAIDSQIPVGAICNAASWMAQHGLLNQVKHTGNGLEQLKLWGGENYTNEANYLNQQAVSDQNIVTANGSGYLEFAKEMLVLLQNDTPEMIERYYTFHKVGLVDLMNPPTQLNPTN